MKVFVVACWQWVVRIKRTDTKLTPGVPATILGVNLIRGELARCPHDAAAIEAIERQANWRNLEVIRSCPKYGASV